MMTPANQSTLEYAAGRVADHFMFGIYFDLIPNPDEADSWGISKALIF